MSYVATLLEHKN